MASPTHRILVEDFNMFIIVAEFVLVTVTGRVVAYRLPLAQRA